MLVDLDAVDGVVRVDDEGLEALLRAAREPGADHHAALAPALTSAAVAPALEAIARPVVTLRLVVAGPDTRLVHRGWLSDDVLALALGVRPGLHQVVTLDPAMLTAALVRTTRLRPRRGGATDVLAFAAQRLPALVAESAQTRSDALAAAGDAELAWELELTWPGGGRRLLAVDGPDGVRIADPEAGALRAATNTFVYRLLTTVLPGDEELAGASDPVPAPDQG